MNWRAWPGYPRRLLLRLSLHRRIAAFMSTILLAAFLAIGYVGWASVSRSTEATLEARRATARVVTTHLDDLIGHAQGHLMVIAGQLASTGGLEPGRSGQIVVTSLEQVRFFFESVTVFDAEQRPVTSQPASQPTDLSDGARSAINRALETRAPVISNLLGRAPDASNHVLFIAPIAREGRALGVVVGDMRLPHPSISSIAGSLKLGTSGHMEVVDGDGWVLASTSAVDVFRPSEHSAFYAPYLAQRESTIGRALYEEREEADEPGEAEDQWHIMAFVPLANAPWGVGLGQSEEETFAVPREMRDRTLTVASVALIIALLCAWVGTRSVVDPIRALTLAGDRMATGDLSQPIRIDQRDEIGRLGRVLEAMRQRLGQSLAEIRAWNQELEGRVAARTRDLQTSNRHLQALLAVSNVATREGDRGDVLNEAVRQLVDTLEAQCGWALLRDESSQRLRLATGYRMPAGLHEPGRAVICQEAACLQAVRTGETRCQPLDNCPGLPREVHRLPAGSRCWCSPIRAGDQTLGALCLATAPGAELDAEQLALVEGVARQVAVAFENVRLTEETARLEAARRMELLRAEFLGSVSHELRTPLGFIKGYATTLLRKDTAWSPAETAEFLEIIDEESDRLTALVDSLLEAARVQAGRLRLQRQPVRLEELLSRTAERLAGLVGADRLRLDLEPTQVLQVDPSKLEQVLVNLIQNAAKYSPDGSPIELELRTIGWEARISVLDRGVGMDEAEAARIFEPFYRIANDTARRVGGTGLGLAICRAIVEAHGGRIWAEPRVGGGTAMYVGLPVDPDRAEPQPFSDETRAPTEA